MFGLGDITPDMIVVAVLAIVAVGLVLRWSITGAFVGDDRREKGD